MTESADDAVVKEVEEAADGDELKATKEENEAADGADADVDGGVDPSRRPASSSSHASPHAARRHVSSVATHELERVNAELERFGQVPSAVVVARCCCRRCCSCVRSSSESGWRRACTAVRAAAVCSTAYVCLDPHILQDVAVDAAVGEFDELRSRTRAEIGTQHARAELIKSAEVCTAASLGDYLGYYLGYYLSYHLGYHLGYYISAIISVVSRRRAPRGPTALATRRRQRICAPSCCRSMGASPSCRCEISAKISANIACKIADAGVSMRRRSSRRGWRSSAAACAPHCGCVPSSSSFVSPRPRSLPPSRARAPPLLCALTVVVPRAARGSAQSEQVRARRSRARARPDAR